MRGTTVRVEGVQGLVRQLSRLTSEVGGNTLAEAIEVGATVIMDEAERRAPERRARRQVGLEVTERTATRATVAIGPLKEEGMGIYFQELGTVNHPPQPWLRPAFDEQKGEVVDVVARELRQGIDRVARG